jgi:hypothetical protein
VTWIGQNRIRVTCSKTEHHEGRGERFIPIFPELRPYLLDVFSQAEEGTQHVISRYRDANATCEPSCGGSSARPG